MFGRSEKMGSHVVCWCRLSRRERRLCVANREKKCARCLVNCEAWALKVVGNERPVQGRHPVGDVVVFMYPGLIVHVMGGKLDSGVLIDGAVSMPVAKGEFG